MSNAKGFQDTIDWYNRNAEKYAQTLSGRPRMENINLFLSYVSTGEKILDAGCAGGRDSHVILEKGYTVTGLDISKGLIAVARKTYPLITFVEGSFLQLPFADNTFDGVWAHASLVHMETEEDTRKAIQEFVRVLKTGGILYTYVKEQLSKEKTSNKPDSFSDVPRFFRYYTKEQIETWFVEAGCTIVKSEKQDDLGKREGVSWILTIGKKL